MAVVTDPAKTVLWVIPSLVGGGAERVLVNLLKNLDRAKFTPMLALFENKGAFLGQLPSDVPLIDLRKKGRWSVFGMVLRLAAFLRRSRVDLVVPFLEYADIVTLMAVFFVHPRPRVVATFHNDPRYLIISERWGRIKHLLSRCLYPKADALVAVSHGVGRGIQGLFRLPEPKIHVIHNGSDSATIRRMAKDPVEDSKFLGSFPGPVIVTVGRLDPQKNQSMLVRAFHGVSARIDSRLIIIGEGPERCNLQRLLDELGLGDRVEFIGFTENPFKYMARCDLFVLSSDSEGFANVIIEAMICGLPVISTRCTYGPDEIIDDGTNGILVPTGNAEALKAAMVRLLSDEDLRRRLSAAGQRRVRDFGTMSMTAKYESLFGRIFEQE